MSAHLSHSRIQVEATCPRKAHLQYDLKLEPHVRSDALTLGATLADALEIGLVSAIQQMWAAWEERVRVADGQPWVAVEPRRNIEKSEALVRGAHAGYLAVYGQPATDTREVEYRPQIPGTAYHLLGRADAVRDLPDCLEVVEDKFRGRYQTVTQMDQQLRYSAWGLRETQGKPVGRFFYRQHLKPQIRQTKTETWGSYLERLEDRMAQPDRFREDVIELPEVAVSGVPDELKAWAAAVAMRQALGVHPPVTARCDDFGGCQFLPICSGEPGAMTGFRQRGTR